MHDNRKKYFIPFALQILFIFFLQFAYSQDKIYENKALSSKVNKAIDYIYNLEFDKSEPLIQEIHQELGEHPGVYLLKAFDIYWKKKPFKYGSMDFSTFEGYLRKSLEISEGILEEHEDDPEASFFALSAHAYLAQLYVDNGENLRALSEAKNCYGYIKLGFELVDSYPEYYFPCGIYDYYREKYPEENPFFKPFLWFFRTGDKEEGIQMLKHGAKEAIFTKVESNNYLFHILLRYEEKPEQAAPYAKKLAEMYPNNINFTANYVEALIFENKFEVAKPYIDTLVNCDSRFYQYVGNLFLAVYLEKEKQEYVLAFATYQKADLIGESLDLRSPHMDSQIYCGMGRVYKHENKIPEAKEAFKKAAKTAEFSLIRDEAKRHLNNL